MSERDGETRRWHIGKEIPIATVVVLAIQTVGIVWWAATISAKIDSNDRATSVQIAVQTSVDRRQDDEALRSEQRITVQLDKLNQKLDRIIEVGMK